MNLGLRDRVCVVSGASRGIGKATSLALAREGASVLLVGRSEQALADAAREAGAVAEAGAGGARAGAEARAAAGGVRAEPLTLDITATDAGEHLVQECLSRFGRLDVLVNNAGTSAVRSLEQLTDEDWQTQWELHVMGPMRLMRAAAPVMADRKWGRIVNVSSSSGKRPSKTNMAYSVTKAAELSLSRAFADEFASRGVLVNAVTPGPVGSELWLAPGGLADQNAEVLGVSREEVLESTAARTPIGRLGTEQEIAAVITFLCSEAASNVVGAAWSVDGGTVPVII